MQAPGSNTHTLFSCAACKTTLYCGTICQKAHWKNSHKTQCKVRLFSDAVIMGAYDKWKPTATNFLGYLGCLLLPQRELWKQTVISVTFAYHPDAEMKVQLDEHPSAIPIQLIPKFFPTALVVAIMAILQRPTTSPTIYYLLTCTSCPKLLRVAPICMTKSLDQIAITTTVTAQEAIRSYNSGKLLL